MRFSLSFKHLLPVSDVDEDEKSFMGVTENDNVVLSTIFLAVHTHTHTCSWYNVDTRSCAGACVLLVVCMYCVYDTPACVYTLVTHAGVVYVTCCNPLLLGHCL